MAGERASAACASQPQPAPRSATRPASRPVERGGEAAAAGVGVVGREHAGRGEEALGVARAARRRAPRPRRPSGSAGGRVSQKTRPCALTKAPSSGSACATCRARLSTPSVLAPATTSVPPGGRRSRPRATLPRFSARLRVRLTTTIAAGPSARAATAWPASASASWSGRKLCTQRSRPAGTRSRKAEGAARRTRTIPVGGQRRAPRTGPRAPVDRHGTSEGRAPGRGPTPFPWCTAAGAGCAGRSPSPG